MDKNKLKVILMWLCVVLFIALSIFILTKVTENAKKDNEEENIEEVEEKYRNHISYDNKFSIDAPVQYKEISEKHSLNAKGVIELNNEEKAAYVLVVPTSKVNLKKNFKTFRNESFKQKETFYKTKITNYEKLTIDDHDAEYGEIYYTSETGVNTYIRAYVVETDNYFVQMVLWTVADNESLVQDDFDLIASTFRELK